MFRNINNRLDYYYFYLFLIAGLLYQNIYDKATGFLVLTRIRTEFLDLLFKGITLIGDGVLAVSIAFLTAFIRIRIALYLLLGYVISGIVVQSLKRLVFPGRLRPVAYFREQGLEIPVPEGVEVYLYHSFPSGHTATAFALLFGVSLLIKNKIAKLLLLSLAILAGYSRVYLSLHFPSDVLAGSVIGVLTSALLFNWIFRWKKAWLDKSMQDFLFPGGSR